MTFHTNGYAKVLCFRAQAFKILHIAADNEEEEDVISAIKCVSKRIKGECDDTLIEKSSYSSMINKDICGNMMPKTLQTLLEYITPRFSNSFQSLLIGNIVTSIVKKQYTQLQLGMGVLLRDSKALVSHLYKYGVSCSNGPKRPPMKVPDGINDMEFENLHLSSYNRAMKIDFAFLQDISELNFPEYNGYCSKLN